MNNYRESAGILIIYDGECPVCNHYVAGLRLKEAGGKLRLLNAREDTQVTQDLRTQGYDLNQGMVVKIGSENYFGADGMHVLSMMTTASGLFNRFVYLLFKSGCAAQLLYPVFKSLRLVLLRLIGVKPISGECETGGQTAAADPD